MRDKIIQAVVDKFEERSNVGYKKYGVTLHDDEPSLHKWLNHIQEELMDAVNYIEKLKMETTDALHEKLLKDYKEDADPNAISSNPNPGWTEDSTAAILSRD
jgi:DNA anti-recombination protein RmuC|tara:strand:+ start:364 stop:669 length:306 start_codon:yes stop_codon:yes gene_type:complete